MGFAQQIFVSSSRSASDIIQTGNGFFLDYKEHIFFVSANHVVFCVSNPYAFIVSLNHKTRSNNAHELAYVNSYEEMAFIEGEPTIHKFTPLSAKTYDIVFSKVCPNELQYKDIGLFLIDMDMDTNIQVIKADSLKMPKSNINCIIKGKIAENKGNSIFKMNSKKYEIQYDNKQLDDLFYFNIETDDDLSGLSGSPVFDSNNYWIGMLIEQNKIEKCVSIVSGTKIIEVIDNLYFSS